MKDLFSSTTHVVPRGHTEVVEAIKRLEAVDCDVFYNMVSRAIRTYFDEDTSILHRSVPDRTRSFARQVSTAVRSAVDYFAEEEEPVEPFEDAVKFEPLILNTQENAGDKELDGALSGVLKHLPQFTYHSEDNRETYMFKVLVPHSDVSDASVIPEITRLDHTSLHRPEYQPNVVYNLTFAFFED